MYYNFAALPTHDLKLYEGEEKHTTSSLYSSKDPTVQKLHYI